MLRKTLLALKKTIKIYSEKLRNFYSNYQNILAQELDKLNA